MYEARLHGRVIARSGRTQVVEGNDYSPTQDVDEQHLRPSDIDSWHDVVVDPVAVAHP
ncbi:MAG: DUF427 domain-containing protein [Lapillicoccus sp.]